MSDKALRMLKHMRGQIFGQHAPYVGVRSAAVSIGVDPGGSECDGLVDELLRCGHIRRYPSPSLTAHGLYRLTDPEHADLHLRLGNAHAAVEAALIEARRRVRLNEGQEQ
jgi:hypothetical protein